METILSYKKFVKRNARSAANHREDYEEANDVEVDGEDEVAEQSYPLMDGSGCVKKRRHPQILSTQKMPRVSRTSQEQRRQAALNRSRARYQQNAVEIRSRNSQHIANVQASNPDLQEESRAQNSAARAQRRRSERIRNLERLRDTAAPADRRLNLVPERVRDMEARANRRENPEERRREQLQNTADHSTRRDNPEHRIPERIRDMEAHAARREHLEERRREQVQNTADHATRRTIPEYRSPERVWDASARAIRREDSEERRQEQRVLFVERTPRSGDKSRCKILLTMPLGGPIPNFEFKSGFGTPQRELLIVRTQKNVQGNKKGTLENTDSDEGIRKTGSENGKGTPITGEQPGEIPSQEHRRNG
ncbi:capping protein inhibiting regulator of actin dynamics-like [Drosophila bipectinata]|uniref:capping protein inhibiting regulator of actin dynamics-like n=1 Tax=Drosophila bipectinata TaxID=42026 RepID=UPI0038B391FA